MAGHAPQARRVLVTGAAGAVGSHVAPGLLARGHQVRGFDRMPMPGLTDTVVAELTDAEAIGRACEGCDTVIHLAAYPNDADFMTVLLAPNIIGTHHVLEQAQRHGVRRVVVASSIQVVSAARTESRLVATDESAPTNAYAVTKLFAEEYLRMYHLTHGMEGIAVRLGWFLRTSREVASISPRPDLQAIYVSHADGVRFFVRCVEAEDVGYVQAYALSSAPGEPRFDMEPGRRVLGYEPEHRFPAGLPESWVAG